MTSRVDGVRRGASTDVSVTVGATPTGRPLATAERPQPLKISAAQLRLPRGRLDGVRRTVSVPAPAVAPAPMAPKVLDIPLLETGFTAEVAATSLGSFQTEPAAAAVSRQTQPESLGIPLWRPWRMPWRHAASFLTLGLVAFGSAAMVVTYISPQRPAVAQSDVTPAPTLTATPVSTATPEANGLQSLLDQFVKSHPGGWGIYVKNLKTGTVASVNASKPMTSASIYKLFVAERTLAMVDAGQWKLTDAAGGGTGRNLESCLKIMINISDNGCGRALGTKLGWGKQDKALDLEGYTDTTLITTQQTSARDVARLLENLQAGSLLSARSTDMFISYLKEQKVNNRLPVGLPVGTVIAHKTGDLDGYVHDAGIVYGPKTNYLVVVMSGAWQRPATAAGAHAELSKQLWQYFSR